MDVYELAMMGYEQIAQRASATSKLAREYYRIGWYEHAKRYQSHSANLYDQLSTARHLLNYR